MTSSIDSPFSEVSQDKNDKPMHANRHVPRFLQYDNTNGTSLLQVVTAGCTLTSSNLKSGKLNMSNPILVNDTPTSIGLKVPSNKNKPFTVRDIMNVVGHHYPVSVIDVQNQEELGGWTVEDLVEYFEDESRLMDSSAREIQPSDRPRRRAAATAAASLCNNRPKVLNQISMEFSKSPLQRLVVRPQFVRDLDWIDLVWPSDLRTKGEYPVVQHYCLTSTAGCYTDFHADFGGTAVWYHVLEGQKEFILIKPTVENLQAYEDWLCHRQQAELFLPDMVTSQEGVIKVSLKRGKTLVIPTGWIHAVYTPIDSVVIGGNFLHGLDMELQLSIYCVETRAKVLDKFRFPYFCPIMYFAGAFYLNKLKQGDVCQREVEGLRHLTKALQEWWKMHSKLPRQSGGAITPIDAAYRAAEMSNCASVDQMLTELQEQHERVLKHGIGPVATTSSTRPFVKKPSIKLSTPDDKPTLRLRLSSGTLEESGSSDDDKIKKGGTDGGFRIVVPLSSRYSLPPSKKRKSMLSREDIVDSGSIIGKDDEEWRPSGGGRRKSSTKRASLSKPKAMRSPSHANPKTAVAPGRRDLGKHATTSRQRLMKRFR